MKEKTRDNLIHLAVAGAVVAAFTLYGLYAVKRTADIPGAILWGILSTPVIVALILERFWKHRRRHALWVLLIAAASINVSAMVAAYSWQWNPPVILWSTMQHS